MNRVMNGKALTLDNEVLSKKLHSNTESMDSLCYP